MIMLMIREGSQQLVKKPHNTPEMILAIIYQGLEFIEYRGAYNGTRLIPAGKAYAVPRGVEGMYLSLFSPANKFSHCNTVGETAGYVFSYRDPQDEKIILQSEHNAIHVVTRPNTIVELISSN